MPASAVTVGVPVIVGGPGAENSTKELAKLNWYSRDQSSSLVTFTGWTLAATASLPSVARRHSLRSLQRQLHGFTRVADRERHALRRQHHGLARVADREARAVGEHRYRRR